MAFGDYEPFRVDASGVEIAGTKGGSGPPILLLHGHRHTRDCWRACADELARHFTVVVSATTSGASHSARAMAGVQLQLMQSAGFDRFLVCAHDDGARVAHRMAMDFADAVDRLMLLDIVPTLSMHDATEGIDQEDHEDHEDHEAERADLERGRKIACPLRVLWSEQSLIAKRFDVLAEWRKLARDVSGRALPCSRDIPEQQPDLLLEEMRAFFGNDAF